MEMENEALVNMTYGLLMAKARQNNDNIIIAVGVLIVVLLLCIGCAACENYSRQTRIQTNALRR